jgi:acyl phosphate:glycerol-3-phosphate acyltransferase
VRFRAGLPMTAMLWVVVGYVFGSIPFAFLLTWRLGGIDVRRSGSGNVGAANVFRTTGSLIGVGVLALDLVKGTAAVLVAQQFTAGPVTPTAAGIAAIFGHIYPVWLRFRGGKGVATACGVFLVLAPLATAIVGAVFVVVVWWTRYVSMGSVAATMLLGPVALWTDSPWAVVIGAVMSAALIVPRHRQNLTRVLAGVEHRIGQRV